MSANSGHPDDKDPPHRGDCRTHSGTAINMTSGVHCCTCWQKGDVLDHDETLIRGAVDVLQSSGIKGDDVYKAASEYLANVFHSGRTETNSSPILQRWAEAAAIIGPRCGNCGHRKVMHDLGMLHLDDRALALIVDCLECYIEATNNSETRGTAGKCYGYKP